MTSNRKVRLSRRQKQVLENKLKTLGTGKPVTGKGIEVNLTVSGGVTGEYFLESIEFDSDGNIHYASEDQIRKKKLKKTSGQIVLGDVKRVFKGILSSELLDNHGFSGQIPPDTLVGLITVKSGKKEQTIFFPMDDIEPQKPSTSQRKLNLHSGRTLYFRSKLVPRKIENLIGKISELPKKLKK